MQAHVSRELSHSTDSFLNRPGRKLSPASKHKLSTDGNLACSHFIDLKGRCFSKLNWNCLNSNTVNKKKPSFPSCLPSFPSLINQSNPMSKAVNVKRQNRKVRSFRECMANLGLTFTAFPISAFLIKHVTASTELTGVSSSASLSQEHFSPHIRAVSRSAASWLVFSMSLWDGVQKQQVVMKRSRRSKGVQQGRCLPGRISLLPVPGSAACIPCHQIPREICLGLHHWITPLQEWSLRGLSN